MARNFLWDPIEDNVIAEFDDDGNLLVDYTTEPDLYGNVISQHRDGETNVFYSDSLGSTVAVTNQAGDVIATRAYSAFGETTESSGSLVFPFQYVGQKGYYFDSETEDYYIRRRPYEPHTGRWLCSDPLGLYAGDVNLYRYCGNSVLSHVDSSGTSLFAVDGTWNTWASNTNVRRFMERVKVTDDYRKYYQAGTTRGLDGADAGDILKKLMAGLCYEFCFARQECTKIDIDLLGYSRGAVIVATAARELEIVGCECEIGQATKNISVRWVGLFDAVNWIGKKALTPMSGSWATVFSNNITNTPAHAIHTSSDSAREAWVFKTEQGFQPARPFSTIIWRRGGRYETVPTTHSEIGRSDGVLTFMINEAKRAGVPVE